MLHRTRDLLIRQRTQLINAFRAHLAEFGLVAETGREGLAQLAAIITDENNREALPLAMKQALQAIVDQLAALGLQIGALDRAIGARAQPVVLALEDLHWADPTTLDVLRGIAERGALVPLFVLLTARPEFRPSWGALSSRYDFAGAARP